jgi:replicative DNA helicase
MVELEAAYIAGLSRRREASLSLGNLLPGLGVRPLGPGDFLGILADTGQLKSATLLNILAHNADLQAVVFSLELDAGKMFERGVAVAAGVDANSVEEIDLAGKIADWRKNGRFRNLLVRPGVLTMEQIDEEVTRSSAKFGCPPKVVAIDYAQLVRTPGNRRV